MKTEQQYIAHHDEVIKRLHIVFEVLHLVESDVIDGDATLRKGVNVQVRREIYALAELLLQVGDQQHGSPMHRQFREITRQSMNEFATNTTLPDSQPEGD